ncbi:ABC transporter ATP-binding protein [Nitratifractor sp.]
MKDLKTVFRRLVLPYWKDYIPYFALAIFGTILSAIGASASAYLVKPVLDEIFIKKDVNALNLLPYAIILVYAMKGVGKYIQVYYSALIGQDIIRRVRNRMLETLLNLDLSFFHRFRAGELISRNINDIGQIRSIVSTMLPELARQSLITLGLLGVVIYQSPRLAFFALVGLPAVLLPLSLIAKRLKKLAHRSQEKTSDITARLSEIFQNIEIIKARSAEKFEHEKFSKENMDYFRLNMKTVKTSQLSDPIMETMGAAGAAVVIIVGGHQVIDGDMTVGSFFSFLTALFMLYTPIKRITSIYNQLQNALAASERILFLLDQKPTIVSQGDLKVGEAAELSLRDVRLSYDGKQALQGVSFTVHKGEKLALVGDSGGGKSSIVNLVVRFYDPDAGEILLDGKPLQNYRLSSLREAISIVTQRVYIFNDTVAANVAYGKVIDEERVIRALKEANAWEFVEAMGGIYTPLREHGANLSGGQRQRIAIARALYVDPKIIIFDEATSALDTQSERKIVEAVERIAKERITIIIAHRLSTVENADRIAVLKEGRILCLDTPENLKEHCDEYRRLLGQFGATNE